jgi:hypothetical protein
VRRIGRALSNYVERVLAYTIKYTHGGLRMSLRLLPVSLLFWASFEAFGFFVRRSHAGWSERIPDTLLFGIVDSGLLIVLAVNGIAVALFAVLSLLNFCRRSLKAHFADRSVRKFMAGGS